MQNAEVENSAVTGGKILNVHEAHKLIIEQQKRIDELEALNKELQAEYTEIKESLKDSMNQIKEVRQEITKNADDVQFTRNHAAKLQHEIKTMKKPQRTSAKKRELENAQARIGELETELETTHAEASELDTQLKQVKLENEQLQAIGNMARETTDRWEQMYQTSQAESLARQKKIEQLEAQGGAPGQFAGQQKMVDTPPADPQGGQMGFPINMGVGEQVSSQQQTLDTPTDPQGGFAFGMGDHQQVSRSEGGQFDEAMAHLPDFNPATLNQPGLDQFDPYGYQQQGYMPPDLNQWQGGYGFNFQP
ncbi:uncharacterized protein GGS22DRAFT_195353 [Annulohypoxylon maeteangense]|uniref:uncharacterized protein n=1 Tax=Annulohypoxylon maeteangense TaxID=1927788 RepID=UPI002007F8BB|nr:uncharacterized protein GGS22DRAFT_195353 [Annulohypoxylon maeteangense]KAI0883086.1 hypothetical protein GGS22DRAFT_195353 [Annulohypoxylon maeteangense]